jgi:hypothetical protein
MLWNEFKNISEELHPRTWVNVLHISPYDNPADIFKVSAMKTSDHTCMRTRSREASCSSRWIKQISSFPIVSGFYLLKIVQTGSGAHPALCKMGTGGYPGREVTTQLYLVPWLRIHRA